MSGSAVIVKGSTELVGLPLSDWRSLDKRTDASLADALVHMMRGLQDVNLAPLARATRLKENEIAASPFGLRAALMGAAAGATHVHRELTRVPNWDTDARTQGGEHDTWQGGVLRTGKYQGFIQDGAHSVFDPSHIAKWGPHELMHRACGFFWRADASKFELYLGSRLNELLPVALWYGADQVARLDETDFVRHTSEREVGPALWRDANEDALRALALRSLHNLRRFTSHLAGELDSIDSEIASGQRIVTKWPFGGATLDPSSDALAYVLAHQKRLSMSEVAKVLESTPAHASVLEYRTHIESQIEQLLFATIPWAEDTEATASRNRWHQSLMGAIGGTECADADGVHGMDLGQIAAGIEESLPDAFGWLERHGADWLEPFAESAEFWRRAPLADRLAAFTGQALPGTPATDLVRLGGAWLRATCDERVSELGEESGAFIVANQSARLLVLDYDVLALLDEASEQAQSLPEPLRTHILVAERAGEVLALALDDSILGLWKELEQGPMRSDEALTRVGEERLASLVHAGVVAYWSGT